MERVLTIWLTEAFTVRLPPPSEEADGDAMELVDYNDAGNADALVFSDEEDDDAIRQVRDKGERKIRRRRNGEKRGEEKPLGLRVSRLSEKGQHTHRTTCRARAQVPSRARVTPSPSAPAAPWRCRPVTRAAAGYQVKAEAEAARAAMRAEKAKAEADARARKVAEAKRVADLAYNGVKIE